MWRWIVRTWRTARTWLRVRIGLARGRWQRGVVRAPAASLLASLRDRDDGGRCSSWRFGLYCPAGIEDRDEAPLIVLLHGCRQNALRFAVASGWTAYADRARVRLLCPSQRLRANPLGCWNWFLLPAQRGGGELAVALGAIDAVPSGARSLLTRQVSSGCRPAARWRRYWRSIIPIDSLRRLPWPHHRYSVRQICRIPAMSCDTGCGFRLPAQSHCCLGARRLR